MKKILCGVFATVLFVPSAFGAEVESGAYAFSSIGRAKYRDIRPPDITSGPIGVPPLPIAFSTDDKDTAYKLGAGYRLNRYFSIEGGYADLGKASWQASLQSPQFLISTPPLSFQSEATSWFLDIVGSYPLTRQLTAFAKVGPQRWKAEGQQTTRLMIVSTAGSTLASVTSEAFTAHGTDWKLGVGLQYEITKHAGLRFELERYTNLHHGGVDVASVGLVFTSPSAFVAEADSSAHASGAYALSSIGRAKFREIRVPRFSPEAFPAGSYSVSTDDTDSAFKLGLGYRLNRYFSIEGGYANLGNASAAGATLISTPTTPVSSQIDLKATSWFLDFVGSYPVTPHFTAFAKVGLHRWKAEGQINTNELVGFTIIPGITIGLTAFSSEPFKNHGTDLKLGVGVQYDITKYAGLRVELERYANVHNAGVDVASVGMVFKF